MKCFTCGEVGQKTTRYPKNKKISGNGHVNTCISPRNDEKKKACSIVYPQEQESRSMSDMTGQRQPASLVRARMTRPALNYTQETSKHTTSATSVVKVDRCRKP